MSSLLSLGKGLLTLDVGDNLEAVCMALSCPDQVLLPIAGLSVHLPGVGKKTFGMGWWHMSSYGAKSYGPPLCRKP